jgi:hypothetical protein
LAAVAMVAPWVPAPAQAFINCLAHPLHPNCCPSPCPVTDFSRLGDLVQITEQAYAAVDRYSSMLDTYVQIWDTFGPDGTLVSTVQSVPAAVRGVIDEAGHLGPSIIETTEDQFRDPAQLVAAVKAVLEDPAGDSASQRLRRAAIRTDLAAGEATDSLVSAGYTLANLGAAAEDSATVTAMATAATDLRGDYAANTTARQAVLETMVGLNDLLGRWAATEAAQAAVSFPTGAGTPDGSAAPSPQVAELTDTAHAFANLREAKQRVQQLDRLISALTALHNDRHVANVMLDQYPGLENTVRSHEQALAWLSGDRIRSVGLLEAAFLDPESVFEAARTALLGADTTQWTDNTTKIAAAAHASTVVVAAILADPESWGEIRPGAWSRDDGGTLAMLGDGALSDAGCAFPCGPEPLTQSFETWLESDKLERFWHPLRDSADASIARLDARFEDIAQRRGYDIRSPAAAAEEARLIDAFKSELSGLATVDTQHFSETQVSIVNTYAAAMDEAATQVIADAGAQTMVMVEWPR